MAVPHDVLHLQPKPVVSTRLNIADWGRDRYALTLRTAYTIVGEKSGFRWNSR